MGSRGLRVGSHLGAGDGDPLEPVLAHEVFKSQFQAHLTPAPARACASAGQRHLGERGRLGRVHSQSAMLSDSLQPSPFLKLMACQTSTPKASPFHPNSQRR